MLDLEEAVARFFPRCTSYDRKQAEHLIAWLDHCGYVIVRFPPARAALCVKGASD
jgi:hypothetical protein